MPESVPAIDLHTAKTAADMPIAYDINGAARRGNVGRSTVIDAMDDGKLIARKSGRRTIILHDDLVAWLRSLPLRQATKAAA